MRDSPVRAMSFVSDMCLTVTPQDEPYLHPGYGGPGVSYPSLTPQQYAYHQAYETFAHNEPMQVSEFIPGFAVQGFSGYTGHGYASSDLNIRVGGHIDGHIGGQSSAGKPKRRRVQTISQRRSANVRERRRMYNLNSAFDELRTKVPTFAYEKRLSRIETLRLAITYIGFMADIISGNESVSSLKKKRCSYQHDYIGRDNGLDGRMGDANIGVTNATTDCASYEDEIRAQI